MSIKRAGYRNSIFYSVEGGGWCVCSIDIAFPWASLLSRCGSGEHHCWYEQTHFNAAKNIFLNCELTVSVPVVFMKFK